MKLAVTGFVSEQAGSVASANALLLGALLRKGVEIDFFSKPTFVDPRPAVGGLAGFRYVPVVNRKADKFRRWVEKVPVLKTMAAQVDSAGYNRMLVREIKKEHQSRQYDLVLWMGDYARGCVPGVPTVSYVQGPPGTDARSIIQRKSEIRRVAGQAALLKWKALASVRLSSLGLPPIQCSDYLIVGSNESADTLTELYGIAPALISKMPYPIDLDLFKLPSTTSPAESALRVLWLGRIVPRKRLDLFLDGAAMALRKGIDLKLTIVGEAGFIPGYKKLIEAFGYQDRLQWTRSLPRDRIPALLHAHDVLCQPSDHENFGSSVAEAQACGLPVIVGKTNGNADYLCSRDIHLKDDQPETLALAFAQMAARKEKNEWGDPKESRALAEKHFDTNRVANLLATTLEAMKRR